MLTIEDFESALAAIDRSKPIPDRLRDLGVNPDELKYWLVSELGPGMSGAFGAGIEIGLLLAKVNNTENEVA